MNKHSKRLGVVFEAVPFLHSSENVIFSSRAHPGYPDTPPMQVGNGWM